MADMVIKNALLLGKAVDVTVEDGRISAIGATGSAPQCDNVIDANGMVLLPGLIDAHVHLREPGQEYKEDIKSGLGAAAHGGFCRVMPMANTEPINDDSAITEFMQNQASAHWPNGPFLHPIGALTRKLEGKELAPMLELADAGCVAFSNDGKPVKNTELFRRAVEYASDTGLKVIDHCEDPYLALASGMNEGALSGKLGLYAQADVGEASQVARDVLLAEYLDIPIHLAHISCEKSVELIRWAKERGAPVTAETCPHYLVFTEEAASTYDTNAKVNPPLRSEKDRQSVRNALADGTIDILATDHAPHAGYEKEVEFDIAPCGITGLDTALSLTWTLVEDGTLDEKRFMEAWNIRPSEIFGFTPSTLEEGAPADFILFDPKEEWTVEPETLRSKGKNTPCLGMTLKGRVKANFIGGINVLD